MSFISYAQNFEDVMLNRAFEGVKEGFYIDVGAFDPEIDSVTLAFYYRGWRGINVEPDEEKFKELAAQRGRDVNLNLALSDRSGSAPFYFFEGTGLSTLVQSQADVNRFEGRRMVTRTVRVATLAEICAAHVDGPIHFLKIDVEGAERAVLAGADFARYRPMVVLVEATAPTSKVENFAEWEPGLLAAGYAFLWFDGLNRFYAAVEHAEALKPKFQVPPNVFDKFLARRFAVAAAASQEPSPLVPSVPILDIEGRIQMTARCRDMDDLARTPGAGEVVKGEDGRRLQIMHNGMKVLADGYYGPWMTRLITLCGGCHEPQEERVFHEVMSVLEPGGAMIELGAYWAFYSAWFLREDAGRRAIAVEPVRAHRAVGEANAALNGVTVEFTDGYVGEWLEGNRAPPEGLARITVPDLMRTHGLDSLAMLHCDTQGAEVSVLEECRDLLAAGRIRWVFVSTHAREISGDWLTHQRCLALLREAGGVIEAEHDVHESFSGDGLIVARFGPCPPGWKGVAVSRNRYQESLFENPIHTLARQEREFGMRQAGRVVDAAFRTFLFRDPPPADRDIQAKRLNASQDVTSYLRGILRAPEFRAKSSLFVREQGLDPQQSGNPVLTGGNLRRAGFVLEMLKEGPLGSKGSRISLPADEAMVGSVAAKAAWRPDLLAHLAARIDPSDRYAMIDVGAGFGLVARQLLLAHPAIERMLCVEPERGAFHALAGNLAEFAPGRVRLFNLALADRDGTADFFRDALDAGPGSLNADAMRGRAYGAAAVATRDAAAWANEAVPAELPLLLTLDTLGHDELIACHLPWPLWSRIECAVIRLWRVAKPGFDRNEFRRRIDDFPHREIGGIAVSTEEVMEFAAGADWKFQDLHLWRDRRAEAAAPRRTRDPIGTAASLAGGPAREAAHAEDGATEDVGRDAILWAYRLFLGREPESEAVVDAQRKSIKGNAYQDVTAKFVNSAEFVEKSKARMNPKAARLDDLIRQCSPPVIYQGEPGFFRDCFGVRTRIAYLPKSYERFSGVVAKTLGAKQLPVHDEIETAAMLQALIETHGKLAVMELGAGWGPWVTLAAQIAHRRGLPCRLIAVEGFAQRFGFLQSHLADNEVDPSAHAIMRGFVGPSDGLIRISRSTQAISPALGSEDPAEYEIVQLYSIATLLADMDIVDLLHCDIGGAEADAFDSAMERVNRRVRRVVVRTHDRRIEDRLFTLFGSHGWSLIDELPCSYRQSGRGVTLIHDGAQVWSNPALLPKTP